MGAQGLSSYLAILVVCVLGVAGKNPHWLNGHKCLMCSHVASPELCYSSHTCQVSEMCFVHLSTTGDYSAGCRPTSSCENGVYKADNSDYAYHQRCCSGELCNRPLLQTITPPHAFGETAAIKDTTTTIAPKKSTTTLTKMTTMVEPTTQPKPLFELTSGLDCHVCSGPECGVMGETFSTTCPDSFPYCMNVVQNDANGSKMVTKKCASFDECRLTKQYMEGDSHREVCEAYDPAEIYVQKFECSYCCETRLCNRRIVPMSNTLILGA